VKAGRFTVTITRPGKIYIGLIFFLGGSAMNTGNNLLYILASLLMALMIVSGIVSIMNFNGLSATLGPADEIFAGTPAAFHLKIKKKRGTACFITASTQFGSHTEVFISREKDITFWQTFPNRGKIQIASVELESGFPFLFINRTLSIPVTTSVVVYPHPIRTTLPPLTGITAADNAASERGTESGDEIRELRPYRERDPLKWVDWKATARRGTTVVKEFFSLKGDTIHLSISGDGNKEQLLSEAAFCVIESGIKEVRLSLHLPNAEIPPGLGLQHRKRCLEALAYA